MSKHAYTSNIVLDLEFTPLPRSKRTKGFFNEIIEIGAVKTDASGQVLDTFESMVKPTLGHGVSGLVHRITGIGNEDLTAARPLEQVLASFAKWIGDGRARMVCWSGCDREQLAHECAAKGIEAQLPSRWLDIQRLYPRIYGIPKRSVKLEEACITCGISFEGFEAHRALYDARRTAELFRMMAAGEIRQHRMIYDAELARAREAAPLSASIASRFPALQQLYLQMA